MKLNADCCRDILLKVEEKPFGEYFTFNKLQGILSSYSEDDLYYACLKLSEARLLEISTAGTLPKSNIPRINTIEELTYIGHEFLENIKLPTTWEKTKSLASKVGSFSLELLGQISKEVVLALIKQLS